MATRRRSKARTINGAVSDIQQRLRYVEARPSYSRLAAQVVRRTNVQPRAIASDQLAIDGVITENIATDAVTNDSLAPNAVTTENISNNSVTTPTMASSSVTNDKMADDAISTSNIRNDAVTEPKLASNSVTTAKIVDSNVTRSKIENGAINRDKIQDGEITTSKLAFGAVITEKIGAGQVSTDNIGQGQVRSNNIDTASITRPKLAFSAVGEAELGGNSVSSGKIQGGAVTNAKLAGGISRDKLGFSVALEGHTHSQYAGSGHGHSGGTNFAGVPTHAHSFSTSTRELKTDISDHEIDASKLLELQLKRFKYKNSARDLSKNSEWEYGYLAEDLYDLGITEPLAYGSDGAPNRINYGLVGVLALELIKQQQARIDNLEREIMSIRKGGNDD